MYWTCGFRSDVSNETREYNVATVTVTYHTIGSILARIAITFAVPRSGQLRIAFFAEKRNMLSRTTRRSELGEAGRSCAAQKGGGPLQLDTGRLKRQCSILPIREVQG